MYNRLLVIFLFLFTLASFGQNAVVGTGFSTGWGADNSSTDFSYLSASAGTSYIRTTHANGTGNQYFRLGIDWSGVRHQYTITNGLDVQVTPGQEYTPSTQTTSGAMYINVSSTSDWYVFKTKDAGTSPSFKLLVFLVQGTIRTCTTVTKNKTNVYPGHTVTVTASLDGSFPTGQGAYLRYSTDNYSTSTIVEMSGSGTSYTADIPASANTAGASLSYYVFTSKPGLTISNANADWYTINYTSNNTYTVGSSWTSAAPGNWNSTSTWTGTEVPPSNNYAVVTINHDITLNQDATVKSITISSGKVFTSESGGSRNLTIASGGAFTNSGGTFTANNGKISFAGSGTISGTTTFNNVDISGGVDFGSSSTIGNGGTLTINAGGYVNTNAPTYNSASTLKYNSATTYGRGTEWSNTSGAGYPGNVQISNNTTLDLGNGGTGTARQCAGNLTIDAGSTLSLNVNAMTAALTVTGNITVNGILTLSSSSGGDIKTHGDVTFASGSTFNHNSRAIFFLKNGTATVNHVSGSITIPYVIIGSGSGNTVLQLVSTDLNASANNGGNALSFTSSGDVLDLNGKNLSIGTAGQTATVSGTGKIKGHSSSNITIYGTGALGTLNFATDGQTINNLTVDRTASGSISLGSNLNVDGVLALTNGLVNLGSSHLTLGAAASISGTPSASKMIVATGSGELRKTFTGNGSFTFPVGDNTGTAEYSPVAFTLNSNGGLSSAYVSLKLSNSKHGNNTAASHYLSRYWTLSSSGITSPNYTAYFTYVDADITGTEANLYSGKYTGTGNVWTGLGGVDATNNRVQAVNLTSFSDFSAMELGALPVELSSFASTSIGRDVRLEWKTSTEINSSKFVVERSTDANTWERVGAVDASGYSNAPKSYSFTDRMLTTGKYNYRLKIVDNDGTYEYSSIVEAEVSVPAEFNVSQNYPNPFNPSTRISYDLPEDSRVVLDLYSLSGEKIARLMNDVVKGGYYSYQLDMSKYNLTSGMYLYKFSGTGLSSGKLFNSVKKMMYLR